MKRAQALLVLPVAAVTLVACGGGGKKNAGHEMSGHSMGAGSAPATAGHNDQDVMFAQMMIPYQQQTITMAKQAATKASDPQVKQLAGQMERAQDPEIQKMTGWLQTWGAPKTMDDMQMDDGLMSDRDMKKLDTLSGKDFDHAFLQMMIKHNQDTIVILQTEQNYGSSADAKTLATNIMKSQSAEITTMQKLLK